MTERIFEHAERVFVIIGNKLQRGLVVGGPRNGVDGEDVWLVEPRMGDFFPSAWVLQGQIAKDTLPTSNKCPRCGPQTFDQKFSDLTKGGSNPCGEILIEKVKPRE